jgi:hypothetical protein
MFTAAREGRRRKARTVELGLFEQPERRADLVCGVCVIPRSAAFGSYLPVHSRRLASPIAIQMLMICIPRRYNFAIRLGGYFNLKDFIVAIAATC